jgi:hypothetical protein
MDPLVIITVDYDTYREIEKLLTRAEKNRIKTRENKREKIKERVNDTGIPPRVRNTKDIHRGILNVSYTIPPQQIVIPNGPILEVLHTQQSVY